MWKFPFFNFFFILVLISHCAIQQSIALNRLGGKNDALSKDELGQRPVAAALGSVYKTASPGALLGIHAEYLHDLWERARIMRQWMLENDSTTWERIRATSGAEADLVEARFHVANAEAFVSALGQRPKAKSELDRAENYLLAIRPLITDSLRPSVEIVRRELEAAKMRLASIGSEAPEQFEAIKIDLDQLIQTVHLAKL